MRSFEHVDAETVREACALLERFGGRAKVTAGGTDLLGALKDGIHPEAPVCIVNIKTIPGLSGIRREDGLLRIGALATLSELADSPLLREGFAILARAARSVGTPQIRTMGTLGGNLCQEVRCWYYRYPQNLGGPLDCLRKGTKGCHAIRGDNRYHAVVGGRGCYAVCPSDLAVVLTALGATARLVAHGGSTREIPVEDLYATTKTTIGRSELVTEVRVPTPSGEARLSFEKHSERRSVDFAVASVATMITIDRGVCRDGRVVLGAVSPRPYRAAAAEETLQGARLDTAVADEAAARALAGARPMRMNAYKVDIARNLVKRAITTAIDDAGC